MAASRSVTATSIVVALGLQALVGTTIAQADENGTSDRLVHLRLEGSEQALRFWVHADESPLPELAGPGGLWVHRLRSMTFDRLCETPCEADLPRGRLTFGLSRGGTGPAAIASPVRVRSSGVLHGTYVDHSAVRVAGWTSFVVGGLAAVGLIIGASVGGGLGAIDETGSIAMFASGGALALTAGIVWYTLAFVPDSAEVRFEPAPP